MEQDFKTGEQDTVAVSPRRGSNQSGMRAYNERLVLSLIRQAGSLPKAEIARRTGLSAQTVSVIMRSLETDGLLERGDPLRGKIGQPSIPLKLASNGAFFFGLKVGRRSLDLVLTDFVGKVIERARLNLPYPTPDKTVRFVSQSTKKILHNLPQEHQSRIAGLGVAVPFQLWDWAETFGAGKSDTSEWKERDIAAEIGAVCDFPVFACNDASSACGAELVFGDQSKPHDFLYFFVGFFIGGALVLDNTVYTGRSGNAAALGSMMVPAPNGQSRQLVEVGSLAALEKALVAMGEETAMNWNSPERWDLPEEPLETWLDNASNGIAHAILSSACLIDVNHVFIDGWMPAPMRKELVRRTQKSVSGFPLPGIQNPDVLEGSIGPDARALGAATLPLSERFLVHRNSFQKGPAK